MSRQGNELLQEEMIVDQFETNAAAGRKIICADSTLDDTFKASKTLLDRVCQFGQSLKE